MLLRKHCRAPQEHLKPPQLLVTSLERSLLVDGRGLVHEYVILRQDQALVAKILAAQMGLAITFFGSFPDVSLDKKMPMQTQSIASAPLSALHNPECLQYSFSSEV